MANGSQKRTRSARVAALSLPPGRIARFFDALRSRDVLARIAVCAVAAVAIWALTSSWAPPFPYRVGYAPQRDLIASLEFTDTDRDGEEIRYEVGQTLAKAREPLTDEDVDVLWREYRTRLEGRSTARKISRSAATFGVIFALYALCGYYIARREPQLLSTVRRLASVLALAAATIGLSRFASVDPWRAEIIPVMLFGMTIAIAYSQELALLLSAAATLIFVMTTGLSLGEYIVLMGAVASAILLLRRVRSRSKLIKVGLISSIITLLVTLGMGVLESQPFGTPLLTGAGRNALWVLAAGFIMTGLLPAVERLFGVLTEISLLELGDVAHPLLQELVRRAPGTYNHSINVASLAEAAAESIGANSLLVRVGAYFHDIGKMFKPGYFIENAGKDADRHEALVPAMSTLIIIAHVKDGADLARQHHLPQPIIDFIEQHHGTTLVEFFYQRASQQRENDPDSSDVEEESFRYPGPRPQTKEAGVLMLADSVESASRVLAEPTSARIESLVEDLAMKKLLDGQFDECGLHLQELRTVQDSLVKSLTAVYHGRVKYPNQRTA